ncbi:chromate efflux transporter [Bacillus lacus]|uniref:Chromate efflux transporter n=1 Tax=Metabacillus lacus TaxID=1983721 RepID=A0A7X2IZY2_9BACI|nr:chromate transporter [Metabacillus lacus]MRX72903.1 chromate efflux transporter [Metabacillus lacus]
MKKWIEILLVSTKLGFTSFGGPIAHLGYFRNEYVKKRQWLDEKSYADLIALCQFLPGPASSQVGIAIGTIRGGMLGGILSWIGFTLPSVIALILFAQLVHTYEIADAGWLQGLKIVAVAVILQAILGMGSKLTPDKERITIAAAAAAFTLLLPNAFVQIAIIAAAGLIGILLYKNNVLEKSAEIPVNISKRMGAAALAVFGILLAGLPLLRTLTDNIHIQLFDTFYRVGSIVFGGGHVVLPLIEREVVPNGLIDPETFIAGYGAAQAVPGPLFTFASFLGTSINGLSGAVIATAAVFLPSFLLVIGIIPFWSKVRSMPKVQAALTGVNAAVVGILLAALYNPVWTSTIYSTVHFIIALISFLLLQYWKVPAWLIVVLTALAGALFL